MNLRHNAEGQLLFDAVREGVIELSAEEKEAFEKRKTALEKILTSDKVIAKYKIEVMFGKARSLRNPTPGVLSVWASGTKLHGGGDEKLYLCPGKSLKKNECTGLLFDAYNTSSGIICPTCGSTWKQEQVIGEVFFNLPMRKWADVLYTYYRLCDYNCDIYLKHAPDDIRSKAKAQSEKQTWRGTQLLVKSREVRARHSYPLRNIIKDTSGGSDLLSRFYAFLVA